MDVPTMHNSLATMLLRKTEIDHNLSAILCLPDGKRIIIRSCDGSFRVRDLETDTQIGEEWEDKDGGVGQIALSPDGKKVASGSLDGAVKLWNVDTGKVTKTWTGHTQWVHSVSWSPDGGRVVSGSYDKTFRVWDVESGKTDAKIIATGTIVRRLKIWDGNSGELLKTFKGNFSGLAWTSDGKTLIAGGSVIDTATWTEVDLFENYKYVNTISLSPIDRILATIYSDKTAHVAQLWDLETNKPIGTPLHHQKHVRSATFSADGQLLLTCCADNHIYTWDVSAIVKRAGLPSDTVDVTPRPAPKIKGARIPPGFFDDALREANSRIRLSQSHAPPTLTPHQRIFSPFTSVWRSSEPHGAAELATQFRSQPFSWTRHISGILRRRDRSDIQLREVDVPCTAGQPRNYHAGKRKKPVASSSRPSNTHTTQQHHAVIQSTPSSPPAANTSSVSAVAGTPGTMGAPSRPHNTVRRARFVRWLCCAPI